ncbi:MULTISPECIES: hypothetical protein [Arthrobacter]|uniref:EspG family protein n=2 Tax=Arthrobacter TaxID=1663 RepID=A0ABU9KJS2_9MICC|nr:hypothetical protein [Arthrobacter sp. YJM1]MDP5226552.1 hypothetical protein [Arthrobacter sp. YJM1]
MAALQPEISIEMNILSWALAVSKAGGPSEAPAGLPADSLPALEQELRALGLTDDDGALTEDWRDTIRRASEAPVTASVVTRTGGVSSHCDIGLFEGRGLARTTARSVHAEAGGEIAVDGIAERMTVALFPQDALWEVVSRSMPELPELTSTAMPALGTEERIAVSPAMAAELDATGRATVQTAVSTASSQSSHLWILTDRLAEVKTVPHADGVTSAEGEPAGVVLLPREPGAIARELVWDVLGAWDFLRGAATAGVGA